MHVRQEPSPSAITEMALFRFLSRRETTGGQTRTIDNIGPYYHRVRSIVLSAKPATAETHFKATGKLCPEYHWVCFVVLSTSQTTAADHEPITGKLCPEYHWVCFVVVQVWPAPLPGCHWIFGKLC